MRASLYEGSRRFRTAPAARPDRGRDQALLRVLRVGICGTDLHIFQGHLDHRIPKGGIIGHETFAQVVEAPAASGFGAGDRVVVEPIHACGECRACRMGGYYLCYRLKIYGVELPGGMQDYWAIEPGRLLHVPAALDDDRAAMIEPLAVATHDVRRAGVKTDDTVLVLGGGPIGALIAMVSRHRGARVVVSEVNPYRIELLRGLGLEVIGVDADPVRFVNEWTAGQGVDVAFEVSGHPAAARVMTEAVRVWGTVSIVAIHSEPTPVNLYPMFAREVAMHGSRLYNREDWEEAIRLAASGAVTLAPLVSRKIPLEGLQEGMEEALRGGPVMKVLVDLTA
jgi:2-desacetyl-2-hydroxyethyl bacteriochlorophyllide A dehydrogenase